MWHETKRLGIKKLQEKCHTLQLQIDKINLEVANSEIVNSVDFAPV